MVIESKIRGKKGAAYGLRLLCFREAAFVEMHRNSRFLHCGRNDKFSRYGERDEITGSD
jgi:hypothetical protein